MTRSEFRGERSRHGQPGGPAAPSPASPVDWQLLTRFQIRALLEAPIQLGDQVLFWDVSVSREQQCVRDREYRDPDSSGTWSDNLVQPIGERGFEFVTRGVFEHDRLGNGTDDVRDRHAGA